MSRRVDEIREFETGRCCDFRRRTDSSRYIGRDNGSKEFLIMVSRRTFCVLLAGTTQQICSAPLFAIDPAEPLSPKVDKSVSHFPSPPDSARPYVLWMWMGHNISAQGITRDLEAMKEAGIGGATIFSLADTVIPWAGAILKSPTPEVVSFTDPWWALVRHAAEECHRLGLELILHNCAGYESSGGTWIPPELSMQEVIWSEHRHSGGKPLRTRLKRAEVDPHPHALFPDCFIPSEGKVGVPIVEARKTYYRDIAVLAMPSEGVAAKEHLLDISDKMTGDGEIVWDAPSGEWTIYRFGHTTTGAMIQPAQWDAMGLECDKMNKEAVTFHVQHVLNDMKKHLGDQMGKGLTTLYFDSYEAGDPTWTPKMREEFQNRRGYDITPWLPVLAGRTIGSDQETKTFKKDFKRTVEDLYRDCYWATPRPLAHEHGLKFNAEPYDGPWEIGEVVQYLDTPTVEFWTTHNKYSPFCLEPVVKAARELHDPTIAAEAFTTVPELARWNEHPAWLKPIGDAAFCAGVNRVNIHHFVQQPWDEKYQPGNVMGQWGIHLGRYQTWWKPGKAWFTYLWRCQALLQRGVYVAPSDATSLKIAADETGLEIRSIHRRDGRTEIYFVANTSWNEGEIRCTFPVHGLQPELWDPVTDTVRDVRHFSQSDGSTSFTIAFAPNQSFFCVFRRAVQTSRPAARIGANSDFPHLERLTELDGAWHVKFDPRRGGPASIVFDSLVDWSEHTDAGIKYYSGTAVYSKTVEVTKLVPGRRVYLDLGSVKHIAEVNLNDHDLGVVWTAPWRVEVTDFLATGTNTITISVTNVWANRLIGDEQHPPDITWQIGDPKFKSGYFLKEFPEWFLKNETRPTKERLTFTTWNYFEKDSPLETSGLLGPVQVMIES